MNLFEFIIALVLIVIVAGLWRDHQKNKAATTDDQAEIAAHLKSIDERLKALEQRSIEN